MFYRARDLSAVTIKILMFKSMGNWTLKFLEVVHLLMVSNPKVRQEKVGWGELWMKVAGSSEVKEIGRNNGRSNNGGNGSELSTKIFSDWEWCLGSR